MGDLKSTMQRIVLGGIFIIFSLLFVLFNSVILVLVRAPKITYGLSSDEKKELNTSGSVKGLLLFVDTLIHCYTTPIILLFCIRLYGNDLCS